MKILITGGCGFLGSNIACKALALKDKLWVYDNLYRHGAEKNLAWLKSLGKFGFLKADIRDRSRLDAAVKTIRPDVIYHLAGQVAMTTSLQDPRMDFEVNAVGTQNLLEAVRRFSPATVVVYSSTNKVYGDLEDHKYAATPTRFVCKGKPKGFDEATPLHFTTPYGCSKGAADQYVLDYAKMFGLKTVVFRHSSIFGGRQFSTYDQGWIGWFCRQAGKQVRDVLHADDAAELYYKVPGCIGRAKGRPFNIGGGMNNSLSLLELFAELEDIMGVKLKYKRLPFRQSDQKVFVADITAARSMFKWSPRVDKRSGIIKMLNWVKNAR